MSRPSDSHSNRSQRWVSDVDGDSARWTRATLSRIRQSIGAPDRISQTLAQSRLGKKFDLTKAQIYQALAAEVPVDGKLVKNPNNKWSDIAIVAYGPPATSGTRDAFVELAMQEGCGELPFFKDLKKADKKAYRKVEKTTCSKMRQDGNLIEAGKNDNLIVQRLIADANAVGIFGYSFLYENQDKIIGLAQALGETAPLLLIGMNAFIPSIENMGLLQPAMALPTQIFSWADSPERGFVSRTSAAILVLLGFLVIMNIIAVYLRQRLERKW